MSDIPPEVLIEMMVERHVRTGKGRVSMWNKATFDAIVHAASIVYEEDWADAEIRARKAVEKVAEQYWGESIL